MNNELKGQGEYRGDFTRDTHNPLKRFSRVLMQQGRVLLDADWNEQTSILLHYLRSLAADLIGPHGGPAGAFKIQTAGDKKGFAITEGHYYVNGILCENKQRLDDKGKAIPVTYSNQPNYPRDNEKDKLPESPNLLVYLDVWERHVTHIEDTNKNNGNPTIREAALRGSDTASRAQVVWQVKVVETNLTATILNKPLDGYARFIEALDSMIQPQPGTGQLRARAVKPKTGGDDCPCVTSPESRYRGGNQLYRVEIHNPGGSWDGALGESGKPTVNDATATFKWSRENGSVAFPIRNVVGGDTSDITVKLSDFGKDARHGLAEGDWVEIVDDDYTLQNRTEPLLQVMIIDRDESTITVRGKRKSKVGEDATKHPLLRRWDHKGGESKSGDVTIHDDGTALLQEGSDDNGWLTLENGIQIQFPKLESAAIYARGDYWLIPARVATGDVEWPGPKDNPDSLPPQGTQHYYAPLAIITVAGGKITQNKPCRRIIKQAIE